MKRILFTMAVLLMIVWFIGVFVFAASSMIHTLAVGAIILFLQAVITTPKPKIQ